MSNSEEKWTPLALIEEQDPAFVRKNVGSN